MTEEISGLKVVLGSAVPIQPADVRLLPVFLQNQIIIIPIYVTEHFDSQHHSVK